MADATHIVTPAEVDKSSQLVDPDKTFNLITE